jgi:glucosamine kinase
MHPRETPFVIGIDAGGTHTRVGLFDVSGDLLGLAVGRGGGPHHNDDAQENIHATIHAAAADAGRDPQAARALVAGIAGINRESSNQGQDHRADAGSLVDIGGISGPTHVVNDAISAHRGALAGEPGIIVVAGTGSMILAIAHDGTETESGQFQHYAGAARHLVHDVVQRILIGDADDADPLPARVHEHFGVADRSELRDTVLALSSTAPNETKRRFGDLAPVISGMIGSSPLARSAAARLCDRTALGVGLLMPSIDGDTVPVTCAGSLASDPSFLELLRCSLTRLPGPQAPALVPARLDPLRGSAILALESAGTAVDEATLRRLSSSM